MPEEIQRDPNGVPYVERSFRPERGGWVRAPRDLLRDASIDPASKIIYLLILDECQRTGSPSVEYSYGRLKNETGIGSDHTIRRKLIQLQDRGMLEIEGDEGRESSHTFRFYRPTPPEILTYAIRVTERYAQRARFLEGAGSVESADRHAVGVAQCDPQHEAEIAPEDVRNSAASLTELRSKEEDQSDPPKRTDAAVSVEEANPTGPDEVLSEMDLDELREFLGEEDFAVYLLQEGLEERA